MEGTKCHLPVPTLPEVQLHSATVIGEVTHAPHFITSPASFCKKTPKTAGDVTMTTARITSLRKNEIKAARRRVAGGRASGGRAHPRAREAGPAGDKFSRSGDAGNGGRGRSAAAHKRGERSSPRGSASGFCDKRAKHKKGGRQVIVGLLSITRNKSYFLFAKKSFAFSASTSCSVKT